MTSWTCAWMLSTFKSWEAPTCSAQFMYMLSASKNFLIFLNYSKIRFLSLLKWLRLCTFFGTSTGHKLLGVSLAFLHSSLHGMTKCRHNLVKPILNVHYITLGTFYAFLHSIFLRLWQNGGINDASWYSSFSVVPYSEFSKFIQEKFKI